MTIRLFSCTSCGHKMRVSGQMCHACYTDKHVYQLPQTVWTTGVASLLGLFVVMVAVL